MKAINSVETQRIRRLIAGSHADFIVFLSTLANPIIVGNGYPRTKLIDAFNKWAKSRDFHTDDANISNWRDACNTGSMKKVQ
jgi:hypothetical protein